MLLHLTFSANTAQPAYTSGTIAMHLTLSTRQLHVCSSVGPRIYQASDPENLTPYACCARQTRVCADDATSTESVLGYADWDTAGPGPVYASITFSAGSLVSISLRPDAALANSTFDVCGTCTVTDE